MSSDHDGLSLYADIPPGVRSESTSAALRFEEAPRHDAVRHVVPLDAPLTPRSVLEVTIYPERDASRDVPAPSEPWWVGYASTGVGVSLEFSDGSASRPGGLVDQYGVPGDAESQGAARMMWTEQWNLRRYSLAEHAGARLSAVVLEFAAHGEPVAGWVDRVRVVEGSPRDVGADPIEWVDARRGTQSSATFSRGNTAPIVALPNGGSFLFPVSRRGDTRWPYLFDPRGEQHLDAIAIGHLPTPWLGDWGVVTLSAGRVGRAAQGRPYRREDEDARPDRFAIAWDDGAAVEVASTRYGGVVRFDFGAERGEVLLAGPGDDRGITATESPTGEVVLEVWTDQRDASAGSAPRHYVALGFDRRPGAVVIDGGSARIVVDAPVVEVRLGASTLGFADARRALAAASIPLVDAAAAARAAWNDVLSRIRVEGATADQRSTLATCLARLFLYPNVAHEVGEDGTPRHQTAITSGVEGVADGPLTINNGFWDTYRTAWPLYALLAPERTADLLDGFLTFAREGGYIPRWCAPGATDCMVGTSSDIVVADAVARGVRVRDLDEHYDAALRNATAPSLDPALGRRGIGPSRFRGYTDSSTPEGLSWTLEGAICDFALATLADILAHDESHPRADEFRAHRAYFASRALAYRHLFDDESRFFRGRDASGAVAHGFDPLEWGGDYTETNAWGMAFSVPHDGHGLADLYGGPAALGERLDAYFATPEPASATQWGSYGREIHEMVEARALRTGQFALSNQPAHHAPFLYAYSDRPHRAQAVVRDALRRLFVGGDFGQGYPGDEDNGEMSAWWIWAALGLYPLRVGTDEYILGSPLFPRVAVDVAGGVLTITCPDPDAGDFIQSVHVDGEPWTSASIPHAILAAGCHLEIVVGPEPRAWGEPPPRFVAASLRDVTRDARAVGRGVGDDAARGLGDDVGADPVSVPAGAGVEWDLGAPATVEILTVTGGPQPGRLESQLDGLDAAGNWVTLDRRTLETRWPDQTLIVGVATPLRTTALRWRVVGAEAVVAQIELLARD